MSGGKGGSQTSEVKVPQYIEDAGKANLAKADELAKIGYTPYYGPDVAAFAPMQQAAFQGTSDMASAFGTSGGNMSQQGVMGGMGAPTTYANGVSGYSSAPMYEKSLADIEARRPGQYDAMMAPFIDPVTGANPAAPFDGAVTSSATATGGGRKVICTALHELGRLSDEMYTLDAEFGLRVNREDPMLGDGYRLWATPVANYIKGDSLGSKMALAIVAPVATAWAAEMAHVMRPDDYNRNLAGKALMAVGHPICRMVGKVFLPKMNKGAV